MTSPPETRCRLRGMGRLGRVAAKLLGLVLAVVLGAPSLPAAASVLSHDQLAHWYDGPVTVARGGLITSGYAVISVVSDVGRESGLTYDLSSIRYATNAIDDVV